MNETMDGALVLGQASASQCVLVAPKTHDTSRIGWHMQDLDTLAKAIETTVSSSFPNHGGSRYRSVHVGMMSWEQDTLGVGPELNALRDVLELKYGFNVETWNIPADSKSHKYLMQNALDFINDFDSKDNLFILYYAGHGYINQDRQSTWACSRELNSPTVDWSHIQSLFERALSDILVLLDCCAAVSSAPRRGNDFGVMETIAACGFEGRAPPPGEHSFTTSLIEVLEDWENVPSFSVTMLHSAVLNVLKSRRRERCTNGQKMEWRSTPVYVNNYLHSRTIGIELCKRCLIDIGDSSSSPPRKDIAEILLANSNMAAATYLDLMSISCEALEERLREELTQGNQGSAESSGLINAKPKSPESSTALKVPHMLISIALDQDQALPNAERCCRWISAYPGLAKYVKVEGVFDSYSTVLILSIPVVIWNKLPDNPACQAINYVTSRNLLQSHPTQQISGSSVESAPNTSSISREPFNSNKKIEPSQTNNTRRAQQMPIKQISALDSTSAQSAPNPSMIRNIPYLEENVLEDGNYQAQWSSWMSDGQEKSFYKHVFVLLLSWHPECDDMAVDDEVERLKEVFEKCYNYNAQRVLIDSRLSVLPQVQANLAVANFVAHNDQEDSLFIVYYAGHGSPGKDRGDLKISGRRRQQQVKVAQQFSHITWNLVEANLRTTRADVFLIFDCCHASDLGRDSVLNSRSFEYLAASTSSYTRSPGKESFTSALIWALKKLARQSAQATSQASTMFTTSKLAKTICDCPDFPQGQSPSLTTRDIDAWQHIILAPLPREGVSTRTPTPSREHENDDEEEDEDYKPIPQFLSLTFQFKHKQDAMQFKKLADHLKKFMKVDNTSLENVQWGGIWSGEAQQPSHRWRHAISRLRERENERKEKSTFSPAYGQSDTLSQTMGHDSPHSSTESTPALSSTSSDILEDDSIASSHAIVAFDMLEDPGRSSMKATTKGYDFKWWLQLVAGNQTRYGKVA
ncbi:hypothetical protein N431DRAFT_563478 [Stipitochalara longipes BDJ]|nr:hypothetical protein N431DRAFT_563478 [Stipitochalara longipes BDJ]